MNFPLFHNIVTMFTTFQTDLATAAVLICLSMGAFHVMSWARIFVVALCLTGIFVAANIVSNLV